MDGGNGMRLNLELTTAVRMADVELSGQSGPRYSSLSSDDVSE